MRRVCAYPPLTGCAGPPPRFKQRAAALREQSLGTARTLSTRRAGKTSIGPLIFQVLSALADAAARHDYAGIQCHAAPALAPNKAQYIQQLITSKFSILLINMVFLKSGAAINAASQARLRRESARSHDQQRAARPAPRPCQQGHRWYRSVRHLATRAAAPPPASRPDDHAE